MSLSRQPQRTTPRGLGHHPARRRPVLLALASGAAAVTGVAVAARSGVLSDSDDPDRLLLSAGDMGVESLELPLDADRLSEVAPGQWRSQRLATSTYSMVGFTWRRGQAEPRIDISARSGGVWQSWQRVPHAHEAPDRGEEATDTVGTELAWLGQADGIRIRVSGVRPDDLKLILLYPRPLPTDRDGALTGKAATNDRTATRAGSAGAAEGSVPPPRMRTRKDWGANESWRDGRPRYNDTIQQVHVHHTANSNDYGRDDVPALIRGMYAYHTQSLGWSDIGYNFLVDRFGRIWVGRAGGPARPVRGAHTLGFNATSTGVSAIGNFDATSPPTELLAAIARVAAWKLDMYHRDPEGRTTVVSEGSDKYRAGRRVTLPVIDGHRDTNDTACPGQHLYDALPRLRRRTKRRMERFAQPRRATITQPFTGSGTAVEGSTLRVEPGVWSPADTAPTYEWLRDGAVIAAATSATYQLAPADVGKLIQARVAIAPPGFEPAEQVVAFRDRVRARPVLAVKAAGHHGWAGISVVATAAGLPGGYPTGSVVITVAGRSRTVELVEGKASTAFRRLDPGSYDAQVSYPGNDVAVAATGADPVVVKPPRQ